ncbi:hypothetical protein HIM_08235 [Hirsutella minnesotensis 3608]|uniref:Swiss Army Knife RNA repair protein HAD domain-containing protein n=1 Tax=Hirsutella minnesotensis 3608 TaxID=1043627 RepID=A0A0F7ZYG5_9HYPO|nr:hypothetical protein HIM_08235 [Hirsutella minnesotensis 3608]
MTPAEMLVAARLQRYRVHAACRYLHARPYLILAQGLKRPAASASDLDFHRVRRRHLQHTGRPPSSCSRACMLAAAARCLRPGLLTSTMASAHSMYHGAAHASQAPQFTVTALGRWSCINKQLPPAEEIKALHVYDFDNTLFKTPLPNPQIWHGASFSKLCGQNLFINGGWWHDSRILAATGQGLEKEEPLAWSGWWNETVVDLASLSIKQPGALCVLLTGRSEKGFADLINKMVTSKGLDFDLVCLKPQVSPSNQMFGSTMHFKQLFLHSLMETYKGATELIIYEDRAKHTKGFRDFFKEYNRLQTVNHTRGPIDAEVVQVPDMSTKLDPIVEVAEVQTMVNVHNEAVDEMGVASTMPRMEIKKDVRFVGYMISESDAERLRALAQVPLLPYHRDMRHDNRFIPISTGTCSPSALEKIGGVGSKMLWEVTGTALHQGRIWAARVRPVPSTAAYHTEHHVPIVVLGLRSSARASDASSITDWQPVPPTQSLVFETTVGESAVLRIQREDSDHDGYGSFGAKKASKRKYEGDDDHLPRSVSGPFGSRGDTRGYHTSTRGGGRGKGNAGRGMRGGRGGGKNGRGRGGFHGYRSLDDIEPRNEHGGYGPLVDYDDTYYPPGENPALPTKPKALQGRAMHEPGRGGATAFARPRGGGPSGNDADLQNYY